MRFCLIAGNKRKKTHKAEEQQKSMPAKRRIHGMDRHGGATGAGRFWSCFNNGC